MAERISSARVPSGSWDFGNYFHICTWLLNLAQILDTHAFTQKCTHINIEAGIHANTPTQVILQNNNDRDRWLSTCSSSFWFLHISSMAPRLCNRVVYCVSWLLAWVLRAAQSWAEKWRGELYLKTNPERPAQLCSLPRLWRVEHVYHKAQLYGKLDACRHICVEEGVWWSLN